MRHENGPIETAESIEEFLRIQSAMQRDILEGLKFVSESHKAILSTIDSFIDLMETSSSAIKVAQKQAEKLKRGYLISDDENTAPGAGEREPAVTEHIIGDSCLVSIDMATNETIKKNSSEIERIVIAFVHEAKNNCETEEEFSRALNIAISSIMRITKTSHDEAEALLRLFTVLYLG